MTTCSRPILPLVTAALVANAGPMPVRLAPPTRASVFQTYSSAQHFHRVSADSNVADLVTFACRAHKDFTRPPSFDPLVNENLLVRFCQAMPHHPTDSTAGS